jgi:uncharacterized membrane protein YqjE
MGATEDIRSTMHEGQPASQSIASAITDISERAMLLVHEEIELAKAELAQKTSRLIRGTIVAVAAGVFILGALVFTLDGLAWLAWWELPVSNTEFFWGFFAVAVGLLLLGALAGLIAARAVRRNTPPVPTMALEEARKIREAVSAGGGADGEASGRSSPRSPPAPSSTPTSISESMPGWDPLPTAEPDSGEGVAGASAGGKAVGGDSVAGQG